MTSRYDRGMQLRFTLLAALVLAPVAALPVACGGDDDGAKTSTSDAGVPDVVLPDGGSPTVDHAVTLVRAFPDLVFDVPVEMVAGPAPAGGFYVLEQAGVVKRFAEGDKTARVALAFPAASIAAGGESGLLGIAFHPRFADNGFVYLYRTAPTTTAGSPFKSVLARYRSTDGGATFDLASEKVLLEIDQPFPNHNGGKLAFGPDGFLYWGLGDGGPGGDPGNRAQNKDLLLGKILRVDVDRGDPYAIPPDNPFAGGGGRGEIFAYGLRNPWKLSFDRDGVLWAGDVGQGKYEEIDRIVKGGNYGWRLREGKHCFDPATNCPTDGLIDPVVEYDHGQGVSVTGGYVYYGKAVPELFGKYLYGDYGSGRIWALHPPTGTVSVLNEEGERPKIGSFGQGPDGEVYVVDIAQGFIFRIARAP